MYFNNLTKVNTEFANVLKGDEMAKNYDIVHTFPDNSVAFPISTPAISFGIKKANIPIGFATYTGLDFDEKKHYGTIASIVYDLKICVGKNAGGDSCYQVFDDIANRLLATNNFRLINIYCEDIYYDRVMGALILNAGVEISVDFDSIATS